MIDIIKRLTKAEYEINKAGYTKDDALRAEYEMYLEENKKKYNN